MIPNQVKLPLAIACGVVSQGIRIRFGRSIVTIMGVALGIAFLMSILTNQIIKKGLVHEDSIRAEVRRMLSFLEAEVGSPAERVMGVVQVGAASETEQRLLRALEKAGVLRFDWHAAGDRASMPAMPEAKTQTVDLAEVGKEAVAVLVVGKGLPPSNLAAVLLAQDQRPALAFTRISQNTGPIEGLITSTLDRALRPEELAELEETRRKMKFRSIWIVSISLVVTVIGISNAMLMSVTERFKEIGTMKCLGALSSFVRQIFLIESIFMGLVGGVLGSSGGMVFSILIYALTYGYSKVVASLDFAPLLLHLTVCVVAGICLSVVAAIYPASVAARMTPATALRTHI